MLPQKILDLRPALPAAIYSIPMRLTRVPAGAHGDDQYYFAVIYDADNDERALEAALYCRYMHPESFQLVRSFAESKAGLSVVLRHPVRTCRTDPVANADFKDTAENGVSNDTWYFNGATEPSADIDTLLESLIDLIIGARRSGAD